MKKSSKMTLEQRKRVSKGHKGQVAWNKGKKTGKTTWNKGISMSEESKRKMISSKKKIKPKEYTCFICGKKDFSRVSNKRYCNDECKKIGTKEYRKKPEVREKLILYKRLYKKRPEVIKRYNENYRKTDIQRGIKWRNKKRKEDPYFRKTDNLRRRLIRAMRDYTQTGKIMTSREYGIDYNKIIGHLMKNRPEGISDKDLFDFRKWHIDHVMPLSKFDLNNPEEVKKAFTPENHQWLTAKENIRKGNKIPVY